MFFFFARVFFFFFSLQFVFFHTPFFSWVLGWGGLGRSGVFFFPGCAPPSCLFHVSSHSFFLTQTLFWFFSLFQHPVFAPPPPLEFRFFILDGFLKYGFSTSFFQTVGTVFALGQLFTLVKFYGGVRFLAPAQGLGGSTFWPRGHFSPRFLLFVSLPTNTNPRTEELFPPGVSLVETKKNFFSPPPNPPPQPLPPSTLGPPPARTPLPFTQLGLGDGYCSHLSPSCFSFLVTFGPPPPPIWFISGGETPQNTFLDGGGTKEVFRFCPNIPAFCLPGT